MGVFEGVPNAVEIRDLMLERLRKFREAGLGDPEDARSQVPFMCPASRPAPPQMLWRRFSRKLERFVAPCSGKTVLGVGPSCFARENVVRPPGT
jgi:hypothetical protein